VAGEDYSVNFMRKQLSHALIAILVLICPLTFSTDRVPDFKPACDVQSVQGKKAASVVAAVRLTRIPRIRFSRLFTEENYFASPSMSPVSWFGLPSYGRAPPSVPPLFG
jgi:hypothetical protein